MKNSAKSVVFKRVSILLLGVLFSTMNLLAAHIKSVADGDWEAPATWEGGVSPVSGDDITIETQVTLASTFNVNSLTIAVGGELFMDEGSVLKVAGNWTANGIFANTNVGTVEFTGPVGVHTITSSSKAVFYNLTVSVNNTVVLTPSTSLEILGGGVVSVDGILDLNNQPFTLTSLAPSEGRFDATARLGRVIGEIRNSNNFSIDRYISTPFEGNGKPFLKDRYLSSPVKDLTAAQWAEAITILGGSGPNAFLEKEGWNPNLSTLQYYYEPNTIGGINRGFRPILDKTTLLKPGQGYSLTVGLDGNTTYTNPAKRFVVLKSKGEPTTGFVSVPLTKSGADPYGWNLVGNPYPGDIDWNLVWADNQNVVSATVHMLDPNIVGAPSGQYYYYNASTQKAVDPRYDIGDSRANASIIASSQGFFVFATTQESSSLLFKESQKPLSYGSVEGNFRLGEKIPSVNIGVSNGSHHDNTFLFLHKEAQTLGFDAHFDAFKSVNNTLGISTSSYGKDLAMNGISSEGIVDVPVSVTASKLGSYQLTVVLEESDLLKSKLYLYDKNTGSITQLKEGAQTFPFEVATHNASVKRFSIVSDGANVVTSTTETHLGRSEMKIYPNPVSGDKLTIEMPSGNGNPQVEITDLNGSVVYKTDLQTSSTNHVVQGLSQFLSGGVYTVRLLSNEGVKQQKFVYLK